MAAGIFPAEHALITKLNIVIGVFDVETGCRSEFQPVRADMRAFFTRGEAAEALDVVSFDESKWACLEACSHVSVLGHEYMGPTRADLCGQFACCSGCLEGRISTEASDHRFEIVIRINQIGEAAVALGVAVDFARGAVQACGWTEADVFRCVNRVPEIECHIVRVAFGIAVSGASEQRFREIPFSKSP